MAPVTASTNRDNPKIDFAGVDAGARMFVGLQGWAVSAKATPAPQIKTTTGDIRTRRSIEPIGRNWTPCRLVFRFGTCKALAKLQLNWEKGLSYQLQRNRHRRERYFNNAAWLVSIGRHVPSHGALNS